jgi:hypothetical protein
MSEKDLTIAMWRKAEKAVQGRESRFGFRPNLETLLIESERLVLEKRRSKEKGACCCLTPDDLDKLIRLARKGLLLRTSIQG